MNWEINQQMVLNKYSAIIIVLEIEAFDAEATEKKFTRNWNDVNYEVFDSTMVVGFNSDFKLKFDWFLILW